MLANGLLNITIKHGYYDDGLWQSVTLKPDDQTQNLCRKYQLIMRQAPGLFELYYYGIGDVVRFVQGLTESLIFNLECDDPYWLNISDVPTDWKGQLNFSSDDLQPNSDVLSIQLSDRTLTGSGLIGQLVINSQDLLNSDSQLSQPNFVINMTARRTQWRYFICNHTEQKFNQLVVNNADGIVFDGPSRVLLANGDSAEMFSSGDQLFDFKQSFSNPFNLIDEGQQDEFASSNSISKPILTALPIPSIEVLEVEQQQGELTVFSPMYVYI